MVVNVHRCFVKFHVFFNARNVRGFVNAKLHITRSVM